MIKIFKTKKLITLQKMIIRNLIIKELFNLIIYKMIALKKKIIKVFCKIILNWMKVISKVNHRNQIQVTSKIIFPIITLEIIAIILKIKTNKINT